MTKTTGKLTTQERKRIQAKFALTPEALSAELARADEARAAARRTEPKKPRRRGARGVEEAPEARELFGRKFYPDFPVGKFIGEPRLVWVAPDRFRYEPDPDEPFRFIRADGETIQPGEMLTDGGSIPRALWFIKDLSPWSYAPAFLVHDWLFDLHHCKRTDKSFEEVRDIMLEGIRTLMETKVCEYNRLSFDAIYAGIDSFVARQVWDKPGCALK
jgi:hypothetical protein